MVEHKLVNKLMRYFVVGGVAALTEWSVFAVLHFGTGTNYLISAVVAFAIALAVNYVLGLQLVFEGGRHHRRTEVMLVVFVSLLGVAINLGVLALLVEAFSIHAMIAKIAGTGAAFFWNFFARHWWVFQRN